MNKSVKMLLPSNKIIKSKLLKLKYKLKLTLKLTQYLQLNAIELILTIFIEN